MKLVTPSSKLYAIFPCTGEKVGASNLWGKSVDETLEFTQDALSGLKPDFQGVDRDFLGRDQQVIRLRKRIL